MSDFQTAHIISLLAALTLVASGYMMVRKDSARELKNALIWVIIFSLLVLGYSVLH